MALIKLSSCNFATAFDGSVRIFSRENDNNFEYKHQFKQEETGSKVEDLVDYILFSPNGTYFLALFSDKSVIVWQKQDGKIAWQRLILLKLSRRSYSAAFSPDEKEIYVADKSGDLYQIPVPSVESTLQLYEDTRSVLGHVSILLDVSVTTKYIITADRDEKIRISLRDHPYIIHGFCLGHCEFVCKISVVDDRHLLSSSGDGTVCVWDIDTGTQLCQCAVTNNRTSESRVENSRQSVPALLANTLFLNLVAVGCVGLNDNAIHMFNLQRSDSVGLSKIYQIDLPTNNHLVDIIFDTDVAQNSAVLYALVKNDNGLHIQAFTCERSGYSVYKCEKADYINSVLKDIPISNCFHLKYLQLFKTTVPGHAYDTFYTKKNNNFKSKSKKVKVEA